MEKSMKNLIAQSFILISSTDPATATPVASLPSAGLAKVIMGAPSADVPAAELTDGIPAPVVAYAPPVRIEGLPESGDIIVAAQVADAMRALGLRHQGRVYSPPPLVFRDGRPLGSPGLIWHADLSA